MIDREAARAAAAGERHRSVPPARRDAAQRLGEPGDVLADLGDEILPPGGQVLEDAQHLGVDRAQPRPGLGVDAAAPRRVARLRAARADALLRRRRAARAARCRPAGAGSGFGAARSSTSSPIRASVSAARATPCSTTSRSWSICSAVWPITASTFAAVSASSGSTPAMPMLGDRAEPFLELAVEAVLGVAGEELEQADDERAGEAEQRRAEGGAHAAELALEPAHQRRRSPPSRPGPPAAPASGWCRRPPAPRWRGRRRCRAGRGRSAG